MFTFGILYKQASTVVVSDRQTAEAVVQHYATKRFGLVHCKIVDETRPRCEQHTVQSRTCTILQVFAAGAFLKFHSLHVVLLHNVPVCTTQMAVSSSASCLDAAQARAPAATGDAPAGGLRCRQGR